MGDLSVGGWRDIITQIQGENWMGLISHICEVILRPGLRARLLYMEMT